MKKIFFFAVVMLASVSMNAQTKVFDWLNGVGTTTIVGAQEMKESTVKVKGQSVKCIELGKSFIVNGVGTNYVEIALADSFLVGDIVSVEYCINNSDATKKGVLGLYDKADNKLAFAEAANTKDETVDPSNLQFALTANYGELRLGRESGNTKVCVTKIEVIRGGEIVITKANKPIFSVNAGRRFEPFKVAIKAMNVDSIMYSFDNTTFVKYTDSVEINEYDKDINLYAFSMLADAENSDTASVTYRLEVFVPRTAFNARKELVFADIQADDIEILDESVAELATAAFDGADVPVINYKTRKNYDGSQDSTMCISLKSQPGVKFIYKNQANKNAILKFGPNFIAMDGSNFEMHLDSTCGLLPEDTVIFVVTAKGSTFPIFSHDYSSTTNITPYQNSEDMANYNTGYVYTDTDARITDDYSGWTNLIYTINETKKTIKLKETAAGFRIAKILIGAYRGDAPSEGVENVNANVKAVKRIVNGQVVIVKAGRMFNLLGAEIAK